jgi:hypothetical protein
MHRYYVSVVRMEEISLYFLEHAIFNCYFFHSPNIHLTDSYDNGI